MTARTLPPRRSLAPSLCYRRSPRWNFVLKWGLNLHTDGISGQIRGDRNRQRQIVRKAPVTDTILRHMLIIPRFRARARGSYLRVSFKNTRETAQAINGWKLQRAIT